MKRFQNLHLSDRPLFTQYRTLFKTDIPAAQEILEDSQLQTKLFRAQEFNDTTGRINNIEQYYYQNIPMKLYNLQEQMTIDAQNIKYVGEYKSDEVYYRGNITSLDSQLYYCKDVNNNGVAPNIHSNETPWVYLGLRGDQGYPGLGITLKGVYDSNVLYNEKDVVSYNNQLWIATQSFMGNPPGENSIYWSSFLNQEMRRINMQDTNLKVGDILWMEV